MHVQVFSGVLAWKTQSTLHLTDDTTRIYENEHPYLWNRTDTDTEMPTHFRCFRRYFEELLLNIQRQCCYFAIVRCTNLLSRQVRPSLSLQLRETSPSRSRETQRTLASNLRCHGWNLSSDKSSFPGSEWNARVAPSWIIQSSPPTKIATATWGPGKNLSPYFRCLDNFGASNLAIISVFSAEILLHSSPRRGKWSTSSRTRALHAPHIMSLFHRVAFCYSIDGGRCRPRFRPWDPWSFIPQLSANDTTRAEWPGVSFVSHWRQTTSN